MPLYIGSTVVNVTDIAKGTAFWTQALGYKVRSGDETFVVLIDPDRPWSNLSLQLTESQPAACYGLLRPVDRRVFHLWALAKLSCSNLLGCGTFAWFERFMM